MAGTSQYLQQDFISYREYTNEKLRLIDRKMDYISRGMNELLKHKGSEYKECFVNPVGKQRGRQEEDEMLRRRGKEFSFERWGIDTNVGTELKHQKLPFSAHNQENEDVVWVNVYEDSMYEGAPIYDDYVENVEAPVYDYPLTFDAAPQIEWDYFFGEKVEIIEDIQQSTAQPESEEKFCYDEVPMFNNSPKVEQGYMKKKGALALPKQQGVISLVRKMSKQPHMLQLRPESYDSVTSFNAPQGSKTNKPHCLMTVGKNEEAEILNSPFYDEEPICGNNENEVSLFYDEEHENNEVSIHENVPRHEVKLVTSKEINANKDLRAVETRDQEVYESFGLQQNLPITKDLNQFVMEISNQKEGVRDWSATPPPWRDKIKTYMQHYHLEDNLDDQHSSVKGLLESKAICFDPNIAPFDRNISKKKDHCQVVIDAFVVQAATLNSSGNEKVQLLLLLNDTSLSYGLETAALLLHFL